MVAQLKSPLDMVDAVIQMVNSNALFGIMGILKRKDV